jgi:hypothetical protein
MTTPATQRRGPGHHMETTMDTTAKPRTILPPLEGVVTVPRRALQALAEWAFSSFADARIPAKQGRGQFQ